ncbi:hypothetical protein niasHS_012780 [Heterodera schachtii]|uniref:C-type lectin domain-containing protein n=1 Tax=Heterodera schachtii TaxID=97005 RepID=A0ABD2IQP5_HETSC
MTAMRGIKIKAKITLECSPIEDEGKGSSSSKESASSEESSAEHCSSDEDPSPVTKEPPTTKASSSATDEPCDEDATNEHPTAKASSSATDEPCDEDATNEHPTTKASSTKKPPTTKASSSATDEPCDEDATNEHPTTKASSTKKPPTTKASSSATDEPCDEDATNEHPTTKASSSATDEPCDEDATNEHPTAKASSTKKPPTTKASSSATDEPCDEDATNEHPTTKASSTKKPPTTKASSSATDEPCDEDATNEHPTTKASSTKKPPTTKASSSATDEPCDEEKATKDPITSKASSSATEATSQASSSVTEEPCNGETSASPSCAFVCSGFGWTISNGNCYKVVEGLMNQSQAVAACNAEDSKAQLVSIADEAENRLLGRIIAQPLARSLLTYQLSSTIFNTFWIGLRRVRVGNLYQSTWANGSPTTFGNVPEITTAATTTGTKNQYPWAEGQPSGTNKYTDPTGANEECVHMLNANGQWNDARCAIQMTGAICKKVAQAVGSGGAVGSQAAVTPVGTGQIRVQSAESSAAPPQASSSSFDLCNPSVSVCGGFGWTIFNGKCYKVVEGLMNQSQAVAACNAEDSKAQLVSIADEAENRLIGRIIAQPLARSLLTYQLSSTIFNTFWIGLRRVRVGNLYQSTWANRSPATFGNVPEITTAATTTGTKNQYPWAEGQPSGTNKYTDPTGANEECVHMINANGQWNDARCAIQMTGAICQKTAQF